LNRSLPRWIGFALIPLLIVLCAYSCAVPIAPGYRILKQSYEVSFVAGPPNQLQIHAQYQLQNVGNGELTFLDANFPNEKDFGRRDLRVEIDGRAAAVADLPGDYHAEQPDALRITFDSPWGMKQIRNLSIEYTFADPQNSGSRVTIGANEFHLGSRGWYPELEPPKHLLAPNPNAPDLASYTIRVPADFIVLARGTPKGQKKDGGETNYRFVLAKNDLPPFVVAGRYAVTLANPRSSSAAFWTLQPLKDDPAPAIAQTGAAWSTLETDFGPLDKNITSPRIVESPELRGQFSAEVGAAATAFPGGAIVNPEALALGINSGKFLDLVTHALARNWFGDELRPSSEASIGIGEGLPEYATIVIDEARNGETGRRGRVTEYLRRYDDARTRADEMPLALTMLTDPIGPRRIALAKAPLFYVALEDVCGETEVRRGLARLVALLRGQEVDYNALRSALEQSTNRSLGQMFRIWLNQKGIPQDFRDRYPLGPAGQETGE